MNPDGSTDFEWDWKPFEGTIKLRPGDNFWLKLEYFNFSDRVIYNMPMALRGMPLFENNPGVMTFHSVESHDSGVKSWLLRRVSVGRTIPHYNPGDHYSIHCVSRVPLKLRLGNPIALEPFDKRCVASILKRHLDD